ncbi:hypothetical protein R9S66_01625, partial [Escherichia coli]
MAGIPVLTNIEERFTKSSPMVRLCQVINGLDTVLHTANGRIICGCMKWFTEFGHLNRGDMLTSEQHRCHN